MKRLLENKSRSVKSDTTDLSKEYLSRNKVPQELRQFLRQGGGYYFSDAFHVFDISELRYHSLIFRNELVDRLFSPMVKEDLYVFGEDLFGNYFTFYSEGIGLLNIESAEIEFIAKDFLTSLEVMLSDIDYYFGEALKVEWEEKVSTQLLPSERLAPKIPFVLGGEYTYDNLFNLGFEELTNFSASIAKQIFDTPDGDEVKIVITR